MTFPHKLHLLKRHLSPKRSSIVLLSLICFLLFVSCKKNESASTSEKEKDAGIHKKYDRGPATVTLDVDHKEITIAERLNLVITVTVDEDYETKLPGFGEKLEQFGIVDYHTNQPELVDENRKKISRSYVLEPFLSGDYTIPPMEIKFWKKDGQETAAHTIETSEIGINVKSLLPEDLKDVKLNEIKPPVKIPRSYSVLLLAGISALLLAIGVVATVVVFRKRNKEGRLGAEVKVPAHELAYRELEELVLEGLANKEEIKRFYRRISWILRRYIENRFGLHAPEQTTEEFLAGLEIARDFPGKYNSLLTVFLTHCDLVKFAEHHPKKEDIQKTFDSCKAFIEGTKERE